MAASLAEVSGSIGDEGKTVEMDPKAIDSVEEAAWGVGLSSTALVATNMMKGRMAPWREFANKSAFSMPRMAEVPGRLKENIQFAGNYACCIGGFISLWVISHPFTLMVVVALAAAWTMLLQRKEAIVIRDTELSERQAYLAMGVLTAFLALGTGAFSTALYGLSVALVLCTAHAVLHGPPTTAEYSGLPTITRDLELAGSELEEIGSEPATGQPSLL